MSSAAQELLDRLAAALGAESLPTDPPRCALDPDAALLGLTGPGLAGALEDLIATAPATDRLHADLDVALRRAAGAAPTAPVSLATDPVALLRAAAGDGTCWSLGRTTPEHAARHFPPGAFAAAAAALADGPPPTLLVVEPRATDDEQAALTALCSRAVELGATVILDETATCARLAPAAVAATDIAPPHSGVLFGASLAGGQAFAALVGLGVTPDAAAHTAPNPVALALALATLGRLVDQPIADDLARLGARVAERFAAQCEADGIQATLDGPAALPRLTFAGQENAEAPLIQHHFGLELQALGVTCCGPDLAWPIRGGDRLPDHFAAAIARIRTLLIEHNSYLSGGLPWNFAAAGADQQVRERGLARYRFPRLAEVDVDVTEAGVRIAFADGELGPITSSGFYLPTLLRGDLDLAVDYEVERWEPGPDSACLGLFLQNEPSTARYYAQLMSTADRPMERSVAAGLDGRVSGRRDVDGTCGGLRLTRVGRRVTAWHRSGPDAEWQEIDHLETASGDDVLPGAKIWSKVRCGGLVVHLTSLRIQAELPERQLPALEPRPDPRPSRP